MAEMHTLPGYAFQAREPSVHSMQGAVAYSRTMRSPVHVSLSWLGSWVWSVRVDFYRSMRKLCAALFTPAYLVPLY